MLKSAWGIENLDIYWYIYIYLCAARSLKISEMYFWIFLFVYSVTTSVSDPHSFHTEQDLARNFSADPDGPDQGLPVTKSW